MKKNMIVVINKISLFLAVLAGAVALKKYDLAFIFLVLSFLFVWYDKKRIEAESIFYDFMVSLYENKKLRETGLGISELIGLTDGDQIKKRLLAFLRFNNFLIEKCSGKGDKSSETVYILNKSLLKKRRTAMFSYIFGSLLVFSIVVIGFLILNIEDQYSLRKIRAITASVGILLIIKAAYISLVPFNYRLR